MQLDYNETNDTSTLIAYLKCLIESIVNINIENIIFDQNRDHVPLTLLIGPKLNICELEEWSLSVNKDTGG